jgi:hypothetical protein
VIDIINIDRTLDQYLVIAFDNTINVAPDTKVLTQSLTSVAWKFRFHKVDSFGYGRVTCDVNVHSEQPIGRDFGEFRAASF